MKLRSSSVAVQQGIFGLANLGLTVPTVYLLLGMPLVMREHGWSALDIGLFQLTGLPAVLKLLLALPIERGADPERRYHPWALGCGLLYALVLLALAGIGPDQRGALVGLALVAALLATWADIPVNALAIRILPATSRMQAGSVRSAVLFLSALLGGGVLLVVYAELGWRAPFILMAVLVTISTLTLLLLPAAAPRLKHPVLTRPARIDLKGFFTRPGALAWTLILVLHFPFISAAWVFMKPMLLDHQLSAPQIAWFVGVVGGILGAAAALISSAATRRWGLGRVLPALMLIDTLGLALLAMLLSVDASRAALLAGMLLVAIGVGGSSALGFGLTMHYSRRGSQALDYGLQSSLLTFTRLGITPLAGLLQTQHSYAGMFAGLAAASLCVFILSLAVRGHIARGLDVI
jgi:MFS transporter, PAT family, beta-lactamase induction signal transducer AmpG